MCACVDSGMRRSVCTGRLGRTRDSRSYTRRRAGDFAAAAVDFFERTLVGEAKSACAHVNRCRGLRSGCRRGGLCIRTSWSGGGVRSGAGFGSERDFACGFTRVRCGVGRRGLRGVCGGGCKLTRISAARCVRLRCVAACVASAALAAFSLVARRAYASCLCVLTRILRALLNAVRRVCFFVARTA